MYNAKMFLCQLDELADLTPPLLEYIYFFTEAIDEFLVSPPFEKKKNLISRYISLRILYILGARCENILEAEKFSLFP